MHLLKVWLNPYMKEYRAIIRLFLLSSVSSCMMITACTKDNGPKDQISEYIGPYSINNIYWTGIITDLNGDGVGERDLMSEFKGYPGFVSERITGNVKRVDESTILFTSIVPVCVTDTELGRTEIKYYEVPIKAKWHNEWGSPDFETETFEPVLSESNVGATRAVLYNINTYSYELHVECSIPDANKEYVNGNMIFTFDKENQ